LDINLQYIVNILTIYCLYSVIAPINRVNEAYATIAGLFVLDSELVRPDAVGFSIPEILVF